MVIFITGIHGFIGKNLANELRKRGHKVLGVGAKNKGVLNNENLREINRSDVVIHLAALTSHEQIVKNKLETFEINLNGTRNVLNEFIKSKKTKKFIYASTGKVYGGKNKLPLTEYSNTNPKSVLGKSKLIAEKIIDFYSNNEKEFIVLRIFNVYGKNQKESFLIPTILKQINKNISIKLGDIHARRDYVYIDDVINAFVLTAEKKYKNGFSVFNICTGKAKSASEIIKIISKINKTKYNIVSDKSKVRIDEDDMEYGSNNLINKTFGWAPKYNLKNGLSEILCSNFQMVLVAGGKGERLKNVSKNMPKVLVDINGKPFLEYVINYAVHNGAREILISAGYLGEKIKHFKNKLKINVPISLSIEVNPLGSAGNLNLLSKKLNDEFVLLYADIYSEVNINSLIKFHKLKNADATLVIHHSSHPHDSTVVRVNKELRITALVDKPGESWRKYGNLTNAALYVLKKDVLKYIGKNTLVDFAKDVFPKMLKDNLKIYGYLTDEYIHDMGTPERLKEVSEKIKHDNF